MTFLEIYNKAQQVWDKSGSPYMSKSSFDTFFNLKYNAFVDLEAKLLETDEHYTSMMMYLYDNISKPNSDFIDRVVDTPNFRKRLGFYTSYNDNCTNPATVRTANINVVGNDEFAIMLNDPFNKPSNDQPLGLTKKLSNGNAGWQVFADTTPLTLNMQWVKNPQIFNSATNPTGVFEGQDQVAYILIQLVVYRLDLTIENIQRMQLEAQDIQPQLQG